MASGLRWPPNCCGWKVLPPKCRATTLARKTIVPGKRAVEIIKIEPVGNYAVRLVFDDMHETGIFSWSVLHRLGRNADELWADYEAALAARGLSR